MTEAAGGFKSWIGLKAGPAEEQISAESVKTFLRAIGGRERPAIPPTYLTVFRQLEFELFERMGVSLREVLHAEQDYSFERELRVGDRIRFETEVVNALQKKKGQEWLIFLVMETHFRIIGPVEAPAAKAKTIIVVRRPVE